MKKSNIESASDLAGVSPHVRAIFLDLEKRDLLDWKLSQRIYTAFQIALDKNKLLGFAIAYVHANPYFAQLLDKTVELALSMDRRVNLDWPQKRWCIEYEKLIRIAKLAVCRI